MGAASFDAILKRTKAKFVPGLTATPIRRDGQQPIIFMQCGPIRHTAARPVGAPHDLEVLPRSRFARIDLPTTAGIQDVFRHLANDVARTEAIAAEAAAAFEQGRKVLVLAERTEHLEAIRQALIAQAPAPFVLHGRMSKKQRAALITELEMLPPAASRILIATGKLVGERFDHPPLDTLVLAMPVSWKGTLQQYAGRLHREHASKADVRIIDFVDTGHPALLRMWEKRQRGYRAMGYRVGVDMSDGQASLEGGEVPGLVPSEQLFAGQEAAAGVADGFGAVNRAICQRRVNAHQVFMRPGGRLGSDDRPHVTPVLGRPRTPQVVPLRTPVRRFDRGFLFQAIPTGVRHDALRARFERSSGAAKARQAAAVAKSCSDLRGRPCVRSPSTRVDATA